MLYAGQYTHQALNRSAVGQIQKHVAQRGKRSMISRRFHAKEDEQAIVMWQSDLDKIRHVFDVLSVLCNMWNDD